MTYPEFFPQGLWRKGLATLTILFLAYLSGNFFSNAWSGYSVHREDQVAYARTELALASPTAASTATPIVQSTPTLSVAMLATGSPTMEADQAQEDDITLISVIAMLIPSATPTNTFTPTITPTATMTEKPGSQSVSQVDGMINVYIPAGSFNMGADLRGGKIDGPDQPKHKVFVSDFWINLTQVTNRMYAKCVAAGVCPLPIRKEINPHYYNSKYANHPAVYISWDLAETYCEWAGGRLPTEAEWERAAAGSGNRTFPWGGDDPGPDRVNLNNFNPGTTEVGVHPAGASPFGVLDMGSNVREWVADWYDDSYYLSSPKSNPKGPETGTKKVLRGGSWHDDLSFAHVTRRLAHEPGSAGNNRGFRCAFD